MNTRIQQLNEFLKEDPNDSFLIYALSLEYAKENKKDLAIESLLSLLEIDKNYLKFPLNTLNILNDIENIDDKILISKKNTSNLKLLISNIYLINDFIDIK